MPCDKKKSGRKEQKSDGSSAVSKDEKIANTAATLSNLENFTVDNSTYSTAKIRATFYPKFENDKSDQEVREKMIKMVTDGLATLEVSLKHSGSLFMYAGHEGGAYSKNSFGTDYTAVGVFVLGRIFHKAWGVEASKKQAEFNEFLEREHMSISMELVTAVLGDHGQRPREDYVVVTAVTEFGNGKPKFYSTPEIIAFCRKWLLPTNHVWLFSRNSVTSFFTAYYSLYEEGLATSVCKALDEVADTSVPGSIDHIKAQGEILEGLVARIVSHDSIKEMKLVLKDYPSLPVDEVHQDLGPGLREIYPPNTSHETHQVKALLENAGTSFCPDYVDWLGIGAPDVLSRNDQHDDLVVSKFLEANPSDYATTKLQEMVRLIKEEHLRVKFKCYQNFRKFDSSSSDNLHYKMVVHVSRDSAFTRYQNMMRHKPAMWPLYRGFFVDINIFKANKEKAIDMSKSNIEFGNNDTNIGLVNGDANLMIKLKFLPYKLRTFLIRNGLPSLFKEGPAEKGLAAYKDYYLEQMKSWNTSLVKQAELIKMLDEWAVYAKRKCGNQPPLQSSYLSEAEPFLEQYAKRSPMNQALIECAGDLEIEKGQEPISPRLDSIQKKEGLIVFFPGIPGCGKSVLCEKILSASSGGGLEDDRPIHTLMGDLTQGRYWRKVAEEKKRKPYSILLADKNAPNEQVWKQIQNISRSTNALAVPIVPESEGTESNPFSLDALAVFMYRVLNRVSHPGNLNESSTNVGYVLLMFYHMYDGKNRTEFEGALIKRFGSLVKVPLLKSERGKIPEIVKTVLEEGIHLYRLHRHGSKGTYTKEWVAWEKQLHDVLFRNADYLTSIQVPLEQAANQVLGQLKRIMKGEYITPISISEKRKFGTITFAAIDVPVTDVYNLLSRISEKDPKVKTFVKENMGNKLKKAHVTLAHKESHGETGVASYGPFVNQKMAVDITGLLLSDKLAALDAQPRCVDGHRIGVKNEWPHITLWTAQGILPKEANKLPELVLHGKATRVEIPRFTIIGVVQLYRVMSTASRIVG